MLWLPRLQNMQSQRPTIEHEFDVFLRDSKKGWHFTQRVKATDLTSAKQQYLRENPYTPMNFVTVYPRR